MLRYLLIALFIIPKLVIWPLIWLVRKYLKKRREQTVANISGPALETETEGTGAGQDTVTDKVTPAAKTNKKLRNIL